MARRARQGYLPTESTSFVGRHREPSQINRRLATARLVTLTGMGGVGKTRLAVRVATQLRRAFPDGVWFVDLTELPHSDLLTREVEDPDVLAYLMAGTLKLNQSGNLPPVRQLTDHLAGRRTLLVLDNCEHLLPASAILAHHLLTACPRLRILASSREPLNISGEVTFPVPPLRSPQPAQRQSLADLRQYESITLFVNRAQSVQPDFQLTAENVAAVAKLCHRLDGLPLAIELAAARIATLAPQQILDRLSDRFAVLSHGSPTAPARQQTLRACVDWSFQLCSKLERRLWARLTVFVAGFELDAVEGTCADEDLPANELLDVVAGLVDKSLICRDDANDQHARYRMLDSIRDYGHERLNQFDEYEALRRRHRDWHQQLVTQARAEWISDRQEYWMARLTREHSNLRAAVDYCLTTPGEAEAALRLIVTLPTPYWWTTGLLGDGRRWLDRALAQATTANALRKRALHLANQLATPPNQIELGTRPLNQNET